MDTLKAIAPVSEIKDKGCRHYSQNQALWQAAGHLQVGLIGKVHFEQNFDGRAGLSQVGQGESVLGWGTSGNGRQADRPGWDLASWLDS